MIKKKITHAVLLSCKKASALIDKKLVMELSWIERTQLHWHTSICDGCKLYEKQSVILNNALLHYLRMNENEKFAIVPNQELKEKIASKF